PPDYLISDDVDDGLFTETRFTKPEPFSVPESKDGISSLLGTTRAILVLLAVCDIFWGLRLARCVTIRDEELSDSVRLRLVGPTGPPFLLVVFGNSRSLEAGAYTIGNLAATMGPDLGPRTGSALVGPPQCILLEHQS
nr:hypothetical protein [Tanacetum cinerariifolium]